MKCSKCKKDNITKANYCKYCGNIFSKEEKDLAYKKTIYYKLELIEKWYKRLTLKAITGSLPFKIISLLLVLSIGIYYLITIGNNTRILEDDKYQIFYNKEINEYYLVTNNDVEKIAINLYIPNRLDKMQIIHYDLNNNIIDKNDFNKDEEIVLNTNQNDYYVLKSSYTNKKTNELKINVYKEEDVNISK